MNFNLCPIEAALNGADLADHGNVTTPARSHVQPVTKLYHQEMFWFLAQMDKGWTRLMPIMDLAWGPARV